MRVGFVGLGNMGFRLAQNVQKRSHELVVHDIDRSKAAALVAGGASWADSAKELASRVDVVFTSLPGPSQVRAVMEGKGGVLEGIRAGTTWIELSTTDRLQLLRIADALDRRGCPTLDCPLTGGVPKAELGEATAFVSGEHEVFLRCKPLIEAMAPTIFYLGDLGNAMVCKLITNLLAFAHEAILGEALMIGKLAGLDLDVLGRAINSSFGASVVSERHMDDILDGSYESHFSLGLALKDLDLIAAQVREVGAPLHVGALVKSRFEEAATRYGTDDGDLTNVRLLEDEAGRSLRR
jgi:3-hydroxyisobutyrate dehydrogenase